MTYLLALASFVLSACPMSSPSDSHTLRVLFSTRLPPDSNYNSWRSLYKRAVDEGVVKAVEEHVLIEVFKRIHSILYFSIKERQSGVQMSLPQITKINWEKDFKEEDGNIYLYCGGDCPYPGLALAWRCAAHD